ncbi:MAG: molecular chaperone DnaJ, partial [Firmicutes bacterium]|nr:molecular chaperone DnaJ [Bacillota bacterium]
YRTLAKQYHPDRNQGDEAATNKFKEINEAYDTLSDPDKRAAYDNPSPFGAGFDGFGGSPFGGGGGGFGGSFFDDFVNIFNRNGSGGQESNSNDGEDILIKLTLPFEEAVFGVTKEMTLQRNEHCGECHGSGGRDGSVPSKCTTCGGSGSIRIAQDTPFGRIVQQRGCNACGGSGRVVKDPCGACGGRGSAKKSVTLKIPIPAGIDNGQQLTVRGEGDKGRLGGMPGSLIIQITVTPHKFFKRKGLDLFIDLPVTFAQAALGDKVLVPTLKNKLSFTLPEATQTSTTFKLKGQGIINSKGTAGDLLVTVEVEVPKSLTKEQKEGLKKLQETIKIEQYSKLNDFTKKTKK